MAWTPSRPVSAGAEGYHNAVANAPYYLDNLKELTRIVKEKVKEDDIVVDFGAGTGVSAFELLKEMTINFKLWLVDNSAAWLAKAYELFKDNPKVELFLLEKDENGYRTLAETVGKQSADHVISANTMHLVPDLDQAFGGIYESLKDGGTFTMQSGSIRREDREEDILMFDDTVNRVHDLAIDVIKEEEEFEVYREGLQEKVEEQKKQRRFVFPNPRPLELYITKLAETGFKNIETCFKLIKITYTDWLNFLRVHRLQAGILPEVAGKNASEKEEKDRDTIIKKAANRLFDELKANNAHADDESFTCEWVYISAIRPQGA
jgi:SAM-dependent methyltransferase